MKVRSCGMFKIFENILKRDNEMKLATLENPQWVELTQIEFINYCVKRLLKI